MRNLLEAIWWWTRVAVLGAIGLYVLLLLLNNSGESVRLWYWFGRTSESTPVVTIVLVAFLVGGIASTTGWALATAMISYRRTRDERRERAERERREEMLEKAARLRTKPPPKAIVRRPPPILPVAVEPEPHAEEPIHDARRDEPFEEVAEPPVEDVEEDRPEPTVDERHAPSDANDDAVHGIRLPPPSPPPAGS